MCGNVKGMTYIVEPMEGLTGSDLRNQNKANSQLYGTK